MHCSACGTELLPGKAFCHACGEPATPACSHCGAVPPPRARFCPDCGGALGSSAQPEAPAGGPSSTPAALASGKPDPPARAAAALAPRASERKLVTVLFCDLAGSTAIAENLDPEDYRELLDDYLRVALAEIDAHEGMVNQLAGDGFMALFGAPLAREDAPRRAVEAGLAIGRALARLGEAEPGRANLRARIGIHTGPVVVGTVGSDQKTDYTAIGDTTNLAARLQARAEPGSVLIGEATLRLVEGHFEVRPLGELEVKGKREAVPAFEVKGAAEATTPIALARARGLTPFVGRAGELAQLEACFGLLGSRLPQVVRVVGDAGSGKSRLVHEFRERIAERNVFVLEGRCSLQGQRIPFMPFRDLLRNLFELRGPQTREETERTIGARLAEIDATLSDMGPLFASLLAQDGAAPKDPDADSDDEPLRVMGRLIERLSASRPVVLVVEDLHWIDEASNALLQQAAQSTRQWPLMLLVTHRPEFEPTWNVRTAHTELRLRPLDPEASVAIVRARAGGSLPRTLERRIVQRAEGNPFFLEEITRSLREDGVIVEGEAGIRLERSADDVVIPDTVQELIDARLDRLAPTAKRIAQVAAVVGRQFKMDELRDLVSDEGLDLDSGLAELVERGVVRPVENAYRFGESLTQAVAYESLLLRERRSLHDRIAAALERSEAPSAERAILRARHLARGTDRGRGVEALLEVARAAEGGPSYAAGGELYREAWELGERVLADGGAQPEPLSLRKRVLEASLGYTRVTTMYASADRIDVDGAPSRAIELAQELDDGESLARAYGLKGVLVSAGTGDRFKHGVELIETGLEMARKLALEIDALSLQRALAIVYQHDGRLEEAGFTLGEVIAKLEAIGQTDPDSNLYLTSRYLDLATPYYQGELEAAERSARETFERCVVAGNRTIQAATASTLAHLRLSRGDYGEAIEWGTRAFGLAREIGNFYALRTSAAVLLAACKACGEPSSFANAELEAADDSGATLNSDLLVEMLIEGGSLERARRFARAASRTAGGRLRRMVAQICEGHVALAEGPDSTDRAEASYREALALARELAVFVGQAAAEIGLGRVDLALESAETARRHLERAEQIARAHGYVYLAERARKLVPAV